MMEFFQTLLNGFLLGLASLPVCATCYILFVPVILVESQTGIRSSFRFLSLFAGGRLIGYVSVGVVAGLVAPAVPFVARGEFIGIAYILLSSLMFLWLIRHASLKTVSCKPSSKNPLLFGFLSGLSLCPPFLAAVVLSLRYGAVLKGVALFLGFFFGAVLPMFVLSLSGLVSRFEIVRRIGQVLSALIAFSLLAQGTALLAQTVPKMTITGGEREKIFKSLVPNADSFSGGLAQKDAPQYYVAYDKERKPIAVLFFTDEVAPEVEGYGGKVPICVACDTQLRIKNLMFLPNGETQELVKEMFEDSFSKQYIGKTPLDDFKAGVDVKGISGATITTDAINRSIKLSLFRISHAYLPFPTDTSLPSVWEFKIERVLVVSIFFVAAVLVYILKAQKLRLLLLGTSVAVLGFYFRAFMITAQNVMDIFVRRSYPQKVEFIVLGVCAVVASFLFGRLYCGSICPFGALSELLWIIFPFKLRVSFKTVLSLRWVKYGVLGALILLAAAGSSFYFAAQLEPFAAVFIGTSFPVLILAISILVLSTLFYRFYCRFLCPVGAVMELLSSMRILRLRIPSSCNNCGTCVKNCPSESLSLKDEKLYYNPALCFNCLSCSVVRGNRGCGQEREKNR